MAPYRSPPATDSPPERKRLAWIASHGTVRSLAELLPFLPPAAHPLGAEAAEAAEFVFERARPLNLAWFESWYRTGWASKLPAAPGWERLDARGLFDARAFSGLVALGSFHRSGFVREQAVTLLSDIDDGFELPFLLIRANDWVDRVHALALRALEERLTVTRAGAWAQSLGLIEHLGTVTVRRRRELERLGARVEALMRNRAARPVLADAVAHGSLDVRRAALEITLRLPFDADIGAIVLGASDDGDPCVAQRSANALLRRADIDDGTLARLAAHRSGETRARALETWRATGRLSIDRLREALLDESRRVRETARYVLASSPSTSLDVAAIYRAALERCEGRERLAALRGLTEVGGAIDVPRFLAFAKGDNARLRAAAIDGLGHYGGPAEREVLVQGLADRSAHVRRAARPHVRRLLGRRALRAGGRGE